jgi:hypothetical protein
LLIEDFTLFPNSQGLQSPAPMRQEWLSQMDSILDRTRQMYRAAVASDVSLLPFVPASTSEKQKSTKRKALTILGCQGDTSGDRARQSLMSPPKRRAGNSMSHNGFQTPTSEPNFIAPSSSDMDDLPTPSMVPASPVGALSVSGVQLDSPVTAAPPRVGTACLFLKDVNPVRIEQMGDENSTPTSVINEGEDRSGKPTSGAGMVTPTGHRDLHLMT